MNSNPHEFPETKAAREKVEPWKRVDFDKDVDRMWKEAGDEIDREDSLKVVIAAFFIIGTFAAGWAIENPNTIRGWFGAPPIEISEQIKD